MKTIAVGTLKGGTGKTTITFNLAGVLAENHKVLLLDVDPQCNLTNNVGVDITIQASYSSRDIFEDRKANPYNLVIQNPIKELPNLDIIPGNILLTATDMKIWNRASCERILANFIEDNREFFDQYDYVLIDTNPSMSFVNRNAFYAADSVILVADVDDNSLSGVELFIYMWEEIRADVRKADNVRALIINKADWRSKLVRDIRTYCEEHPTLSKILVPQILRNTVAYPRAALSRKPVTLYKGQGGSDAAEEIRAVADNLFERGVF